MPGAYEKVQADRKRYVDMVVEQMQKGEMPSQWAWNSAALRPHNPSSGAYYRGGNRFKLMLTAMLMEYKDPRWMTFKQIEDKGYRLKKGSKGVLCEKYIFEKKEKEEDGTEVTVKLKTPIVNYFYVYNGQAIEGLEPLSDEKDASEIMQIADDMMHCSECPIHETVAAQAFYAPSEDFINLPLRSVFKDDISFLSTLLHEMSHSTGHPTRLNRQIANSFGTEAYAKEELRAELGALLTQADLGITLGGEHIVDHSNYLVSWGEMIKDDPNEFFRAVNDAEHIADRLMKNYNEYLEKKNTEQGLTENTKTEEAPEKGSLYDFEIWQTEDRDRAFWDLDQLKRMGIEFDPNVYDLIYASSRVSTGMTDADLEGLYREFNIGKKPAGYEGHSLSVSDIVVIRRDDGYRQAYMVSDIGFEKIAFNPEEEPLPIIGKII